MSPAPIKTVSGNIRNILVAYCTTLPARRDQDIRIKCYHRKSGPVPASLLSLLKDKHCVICFACYNALRRLLSWELWGNCEGLFKRNFKIWNACVQWSQLSYMLMWALSKPWPGQCQAGSGVPIKCRSEELVVGSYLCGDYPEYLQYPGCRCGSICGQGWPDPSLSVWQHGPLNYSNIFMSRVGCII